MTVGGQLGSANPDTGAQHDHHAKLSADAAEVFCDLKNPKASLAWNRRAAAMPAGVFTHSVGMRLVIVGTAHLQARDLDQGLELGNRSIDILARVQSSRAKDYVSSTPPSPLGAASRPSATLSTALVPNLESLPAPPGRGPFIQTSCSGTGPARG
ncbi:hypothetical protein GCM10010347_64390 [Streptomyces cirratus]|uniref:Uncharacterized protein n=1 Tax=Streptomyces cirratus TaxID=68187 RepID=A0ABQ3F575_9ACTN|nr:hypothetical protein [Streptomyces cirratus]GHB84563.1 hypothetical protein GCM10010347_64390 [Streptomyces cirratus]